MAKYSGPGEVGTGLGAISANTAKAITFTHPKGMGLISNNSGVDLYVLLNDNATTPTVSTSVWTHVIPDTQGLEWSDLDVSCVGVYLNATSGVMVRGWPTV